ncbi:hypothetical protein N8Z76_02470 [Gammaproteobacteria bacterium]|nr:hypothetical protein [Gammaproteobacteria bacterium]
MPITRTEIKERVIQTGNTWLDAVLKHELGKNFSIASLFDLQEEVTFSFVAPAEINSPEDVDGRGSIVLFSAAQKEAVRKALSYVSDLTGIPFSEAESDSANLHFYNANIIDPTDYYSPFMRIRYSYDPDSLILSSFALHQTEVIFDTDSGLRDLTPGKYGYEKLLYSIGFALGLEPGNIIPDEFNNKDFTLYSSAYDTQYRTEFGSIDKAALTFLYGGDGIKGEYGYYTAESMFEVPAGVSLLASESNDLIKAFSPEPTSQLRPLLINGGGGEDTVSVDTNFSEVLVTRNPISQNITITGKNGATYNIVNVETLKIGEETINIDNLDYLGETAFDFNSWGDKPVYEFYNASSDAYFYTADISERNTILLRSIKSDSGSAEIQSAESTNSSYTETVNATNLGKWQYFYLGSSFNAASTNNAKSIAIHRFYNVDTGHHLWSIDPNEIALIKSKWESGEWSYRYEGTSYNVYRADPDPRNPAIGEEVYRLYNSNTGRHFYTADIEEIGLLQLTGQWSLEGVAFWGE